MYYFFRNKKGEAEDKYSYLLDQREQHSPL